MLNCLVAQVPRRVAQVSVVQDSPQTGVPQVSLLRPGKARNFTGWCPRPDERSKPQMRVPPVPSPPRRRDRGGLSAVPRNQISIVKPCGTQETAGILPISRLSSPFQPAMSSNPLILERFPASFFRLNLAGNFSAPEHNECASPRNGARPASQSPGGMLSHLLWRSCKQVLWQDEFAKDHPL